MSIAAVAELVRRETGITHTVANETVVRAALRRVAPDLEPGDFMRAASDPVRGRGLVERLIDEVTVQETTFVRDRGQLDSIPWHGLLRSARAAGSAVIRVWSAGCATGEEPYTLALLAAEAFAPAPAPVDVLGTDISGGAIAAATEGRYRERAVRALDAALRRRYLDHQGDGTYLVSQRLRRLVRFRRHNLVRDPVPPAGEAGFDIITCRNVLIYFDVPVAERVMRRLDSALRPDGKLLLGVADALRRTFQITPAGKLPIGPRTARALDHSPVPRPRTPPPEPGGGSLEVALAAAGKGYRDIAIAEVQSLLARNPLDADAHFVYGLVVLEAGEPARAVAAFRRALYIDPTFALAAFTLGCAYDALGDKAAARRAYEQALRTLDPGDTRHEVLLQQVDIGDIAAACQTRLNWHRGS
jgi:chemotaxis protein methyltransferase CheR